MKSLKIFAIFVMLFCFGAVNAYAARVVYVKKAPPAPRVVVKKPACPYKKAVWVNGHWTWKKNQYVWVAGHWVKVKPGYRWIDGHWKKTPHGWIYVKGHWAK